jgi:hypothetical protein
MLERYAVKVARTVLRRGGGSNLFSLFDFAPQETGRSSAKSNNGAEGIGESKKRMTTCNEMYRGSRFASIRKDADLL